MEIDFVFNAKTIKIYQYIRNAQGDIIGLVDGEGVQVVAYTYDDVGSLVTTSGSLAGTVGELNPYRYKGYRYDTGEIYDIHKRYYTYDSVDKLVSMTVTSPSNLASSKQRHG